MGRSWTSVTLVAITFAVIGVSGSLVDIHIGHVINLAPGVQIPTECPKINSMNETIHLAHESDCTKFYKCDWGKKVLFECPVMDDKGNRLHFNPVLQICDWPDQAGCIILTTPGEQYTETTTKQGSQKPSTESSATLTSEAITGPTTELWTEPTAVTTDKTTWKLSSVTATDSTTIRASHKPSTDYPTKPSSDSPTSTQWIETSRESTSITSISVTDPANDLTTHQPSTEHPTDATKGSSTSQLTEKPTKPTTHKTTLKWSSVVPTDMTELPTSQNPSTSEDPTDANTGVTASKLTEKPTERTTHKTPSKRPTESTEKPTSNEPDIENPTKTTTESTDVTQQPTEPITNEASQKSSTEISPTGESSTEPSTPTPTEPSSSTTTEPTKPTPTEPSSSTTTEPTTPTPTEPSSSTTTEPTTPTPTEPSSPTTTEATTPTPTGTTVSVEDVNQNSSVTPSGIFVPHEWSCSHYYQIVGDERILLTCAEGLHFSPTQNVCLEPSKAGCDLTTPMPPTSTPSSGDWCGEIADGWVVSHECVCEKYYKCSNGDLIVKECPEGQHFNPSIFGCSSPESAGCDSTVTETTPDSLITLTTPLPTECPPDNTGDAVLLPYPYNCSLYYHCDNGEKILQSCPPGLEFNAREQACDWPELAGCTVSTTESVTDPSTLPPSSTTEDLTQPPSSTTEDPTSPPPTTQDPTSPPPTTEDPTSPPPTTEDPTSPPPTTEDPTSPPPTTEDPTSPPPTTEDPTSPPPTTEDPTSPPPTTEDPTSPPPTTEDPTSPPPTTEDPTSPPPTTEDPTSPPTTTEAANTIPICEDGSRTSHETNCSLYYECKNGEMQLESCRKGMLFNSLLGICDWADNVDCSPPTDGPSTTPSSNYTGTTNITDHYLGQETTTPKSGLSSCIGSCPPRDPPTPVYLVNEDCRKFCQCSNGRAYLFDCPANLHFNPKKHVCDYPSRAGCTGKGGSAHSKH